MIQYNWRQLKKYSFDEIITLIEYTKEPRDSYLLNIVDLINTEKNATEDELYIYLDLASRRNFYDYKYNRDCRLKTIVVNDYDIEKLKMNTLLKIENNEIKFKYEEI